MFRLVSILFFVMTSACGTIEHNEVGLENSSKLIIRSERLEGARIYINDALVKSITSNDLLKYKKGVLGVSDRKNERLETFSLSVDEGLLDVSIIFGNTEVFNKDLYLGKGQTREVRIKRWKILYLY